MVDENDLRIMLMSNGVDETTAREYSISTFLWDGDVAPLIRLLRLGDPLPQRVREVLVMMLEQDEDLPSTLEVVRKQKGAPKDRVAKLVRDGLVGVSVAYYMKEHGPGTYEAAVKEAASMIGVSESVARRSYAKFKDYQGKKPLNISD